MKYLILIIIAITAIACNNEGGDFIITGKVKNPQVDSVYLEQLFYETAETKKIDSAKLSSDGTYTLKGNSAQQNLFIISFKDNPTVIAVNDAKDIKIDFDGNGFNYPYITGSEATKELYKFIKDYWQKDSLLSLTYYQLDTITEASMHDTAFIKEVQQKYTRQLSALGDVIRSFAGSSDNPAVICFVLDKAKGAIAPEELSALIQNASKRFPEHTGITTFKTAIAKQSSSNPNAAYALLNQQAPDLTMTTPDGKKLSISNFKGKYLLVDFWASWCAPCRQENPNVVAAYNKFKERNFAILGVSLDDDKAAWIKAVKDDNLTWPHMSDLQSPSAAASLYLFNGIPFNVLIDPQGKIVASGLRGAELEQKLTEVLQ